MNNDVIREDIRLPYLELSSWYKQNEKAEVSGHGCITSRKEVQHFAMQMSDTAQSLLQGLGVLVVTHGVVVVMSLRLLQPAGLPPLLML